MRILGIDPGLTRCGVGIVRVNEQRRMEFEHVEVLRSAPDLELPARLALLGKSLESLIAGGSIDAVALERVFAQQNLPSVMGVAHISGIVMYLAECHGIPVTLYTPNEVKSRVTGYGAADKNQVTNMVMKHLRLQTAPKPADAADALALAITHAQTLRFGAVEVATENRKRGAGQTLTPAQRAWFEAEKATGRR